MSYGASMFVLALVSAGFLLLAICAWHNDKTAEADETHHRRLLEELSRMPQPERDPWQMDGE